MDEDKITQDNQVQDPEESLTVTFRTPYTFEGKEIAELDLNGLFDLTTADLMKAGAYARRKGVSATLPETTIEYCSFVAAQAADLPIEFFNTLKARDMLKVKNTVFNFFYGED